MRKIFILVLPLASLMLCVGCDESSYGYGQPNYAAPAASQTAARPQSEATPAAGASASTAYRRNSTTQPLPSGYGYLHEKDLSGGSLPAGTPLSQMPGSTASSGGI